MVVHGHTEFFVNDLFCFCSFALQGALQQEYAILQNSSKFRVHCAAPRVQLLCLNAAERIVYYWSCNAQTCCAVRNPARLDFGVSALNY